MGASPARQRRLDRIGPFREPVGEMVHSLTTQEANAYRERGFFVREGVLGERDVEELRQATERIHQLVVEKTRAGEAGPDERISGFRTLRPAASSGSGAETPIRSGRWNPCITWIPEFPN